MALTRHEKWTEAPLAMYSDSQSMTKGVNDCCHDDYPFADATDDSYGDSYALADPYYSYDNG